ncbi:SUKH-4 family immunity protein [Fulvivirgaceae bacterium PWU4]|uniref:SUKH-4 family immunity protein n=1 Tax=Chryseosolibacter histidini TaxID=2782349 RepID=A0AAP2GN01_9BACT|nr:SUKH-4 family immunity protein [Chryseosolibacter histidini]MBT1695977.1 SUKH-4 family immunity protein [Chryseosolibacter histidini]
MTRKFSKIELFWKEKLRTLPSDLVARFNFDDNTSSFLTTVGLPADLSDLNKALEINFYFEPGSTEFMGDNYCVLGDDSGTYFAISLSNHQLYAIDLDKVTGHDPVCFVNSTIDKFIETIQLFIEFQRRSLTGKSSEADLIKLMVEKMKDVDKQALASKDTWWGSIVSESI